MSPASLTTKNGITAGDTVIWARESRVYPRQNSLAKKLLKHDVEYKVEFVFPGNPEQLELEGIEQLFVYDMFRKWPPPRAKKV
jgi:hypothetical protein